ncbi:hypothetical protein U9M48_043796 [Paspalum notatum var. saurae]|uniref:Uncharacterized protein n=1 Tax=Paspalum notatum var. saurae TaxID=547442 RepID=A0AAQ3XIX2_PASNO
MAASASGEGKTGSHDPGDAALPRVRMEAHWLWLVKNQLVLARMAALLGRSLLLLLVRVLVSKGGCLSSSYSGDS